MNHIIGFLAYGLDRPHTGIGRYSFELIRALAMLNNNPQIILLLAGSPGPLSSLSKFRHFRLGGSRFIPGLLLLGQLSINRAAIKHNLDLIHDPTGVTPFILVKDQCKTVVTVHDVFAWSTPGHSSSLETLIYKRWLPRILPEIDALITGSHQSKCDIVRHLPVKSEKVTVIPNAINKTFRVLTSEETHRILAHSIDMPYILYVGSSSTRKNVPRLIEAYGQLRSWSDKWTLVIAGGGNWGRMPVIKIVEELCLSNCIHFPGYIADEDLPALYNGADLFVFPSLYEGFGLPVIEAMACGTPVITSCTSSLPEVAGEAALLVDPTNVDEIAEAMRRVLEDKELAQDLRERGLERAKLFTWERTARETIKVYEKVLGEKILDDD